MLVLNEKTFSFNIVQKAVKIEGILKLRGEESEEVIWSFVFIKYYLEYIFFIY
jgi:hypothetical protein